MRILDRYILKSILSIFLGCMITFFFLYIVIDLLSHLDIILERHIALDMLREYYLSYLPIIFVQISPIACLLATLYTFAKLNRDNEIIVMRSSGMNIFQITQTAIMFGILATLVVFMINDRYVPQALATTKKIKESMEGDNQNLKKNEIIENLSMFGSNNRLFFVNKFYLKTNTMENIIILEHDNRQNIIRKIIASKGNYSEGMWKFFNCSTFNFDENGQVIGEPDFQEEEIVTIIEKPKDFLNQRQRPEYMSISELSHYMHKLNRSGAVSVIRELKVDLYRKLTEPLTSFIIIFLGIPFAMKLRKRATGVSSIGVSVMVGFLYHVLNAVSIAMGKAGILIPIVSTSLVHILAFAISLYLILTLP